MRIDLLNNQQTVKPRKLKFELNERNNENVMCRGTRRNFFGGGRGKRRIYYLLHKIKPYSGNQDFAKRFEPKVNMTLLKKMLRFEWHVEQTDAIQVYYGQGSGGKAHSRWVIFAISGKK